MLFRSYTSGGENASHSVQSEGLAMMEGTRVEVKMRICQYNVAFDDHVIIGSDTYYSYMEAGKLKREGV